MKLVTSFLLIFSTVYGDDRHAIGGSRDSHNCLTGAGYQWCESTQSCGRPWITKCEDKNKCSDVMCAMYCSQGFEIGNDGCQICKCKETKVDDKCQNWYYQTCSQDEECNDNYHCILQRRNCLSTRCNCKGLCTRDCSRKPGICEKIDH